MVKDMLISLRFIVGTLLVCAVIYPALLFGIGQVVAPAQAAGSLIRNEGGTIIGSSLIAQKFTHAGYLWPRPSAVDYNAAAAGGSNLAASNPELRRRAEAAASRLTATEVRRAPSELVAASGSGLDPDITLDGALFQVERIARARGVNVQRVMEVLHHEATAGTPWSPQLVNVLETNLALDKNLGSLSLR